MVSTLVVGFLAEDSRSCTCAFFGGNRHCVPAIVVWKEEGCQECPATACGLSSVGHLGSTGLLCTHCVCLWFELLWQRQCWFVCSTSLPKSITTKMPKSVCGRLGAERVESIRGQHGKTSVAQVLRQDITALAASMEEARCADYPCRPEGRIEVEFGSLGLRELNRCGRDEEAASCAPRAMSGVVLMCVALGTCVAVFLFFVFPCVPCSCCLSVATFQSLCSCAGIHEGRERRWNSVG